MYRTYFGNDLSDSMFVDVGECIISRHPLSVEEVRKLVREGIESCLDSSHAAMITALRQRFGIDIPIPATPSQAILDWLDRIVVVEVRDLPHLPNGHEYTDQEVKNASFAFSLYSVVSIP